MPTPGTITWIIAIGMLLFTFWIKRNEWFGPRKRKVVTHHKAEPEATEPPRVEQAREFGTTISTWYTDKWQKTTWWNVVAIMISVVMIDYMVFVLFPTAKTRVWENLGLVIVLHVFYCFALTNLPVGAKWRGRTAMLVILLCITTLTTKVLGLTPWIGEGTKVFANSGVKTGTADTGMLPLNRENEVDVREFWNSSDLPQTSMKVGMINHAEKESGFNQFRPDGSIYKNQNSSAIGVMQIMESQWADEAKGKFNLYTQEGNLNFALWLVKKRIAEGKRFDIDWDATSPRAAIETIALTEDFGEELKTFGQFDWTSDGPISIMKDDGTIVDDKPAGRTIVGCTSTVRFRSRAPEGSVNKVTLIRKFLVCRE